MEALQKVIEFLSLSESSARILLIHNRWDVTKILELFDRKGKEQLFLEAGLVLDDNNNNNNNNDSSFSALSQITCNVCFDDFSKDEFSVMSCGHYYCNNCKFFNLFCSTILFFCCFKVILTLYLILLRLD